MTARRTIPERRLAWLREELAEWRAEGFVDAAGADAIAGRYEGGRRFRVVGLLIGLGGALLGAGLIWLVASNLDIEEIGPLARFLGVAVLWLAAVAVGEVAVASDRLRVITGPARLLAVLLFGGAIFQAAQSLQVPAFEPSLLAAWGAGGLLYAYASRSAAALVPATVVAASWYVLEVAAEADGGAVVGALALPVPVCAAVAAVHRTGSFAATWRTLAALLGLIALFVAALPGVAGDDLEWTRTLVLGLVGAAVAGAIGLIRGARERRDEVVGALALAAVAIALVVIAPNEGPVFESRAPTGGETMFVLAAMLAYVAWAVGVAVIGAARDAAGLVNLAFAGLLLFVAVQSFGLIAELISGAALLLCVGSILVGLGLALDRGRRRLLREGSPR